MQTIIVDMTPGFRMPTIYYSQGDVGTQFAIDLRSRFGDSFPTGTTVTIQATKPSGFGFSVSADSTTGGLCVFTTTAEMTDEFGRFPAELKVAKTGLTLFTANFYMDGEENTHPEGTTDGSQETVIPELTQLVERVEDAASSVLDMTVVANTLPAGSDATYSYDEETNTATFGIPKGADGSLASGVLAPTYSSSSTYAVGDYVYYSGSLYRCTTAITTAEAWTSGHWTQVALAPEVSDLKSDLIFSNIGNAFDGLLSNSYWSESGVLTPYNGDVCNTNKIPCNEGDPVKIMTIPTISDAIAYVSFFDSSGTTRIKRESKTGTDYEGIAPEGAKFVCFTFEKAYLTKESFNSVLVYVNNAIHRLNSETKSIADSVRKLFSVDTYSPIISNGSAGNTSNPIAVHTHNYIPCGVGDLVTINVSKAPKETGGYYSFAVNYYNYSKVQVFLDDYGRVKERNKEIVIVDNRVAFIKFSIVEVTEDGTDYTALRERDFTASDVQIIVEPSGSISRRINNLEQEINGRTIVSDEIVQGTYDNYGHVISSTTRIRTRNVLEVSNGQILEFVGGVNAHDMMYGKFNKDGTFISESTWLQGKATAIIDWDGYIVLLFRKSDNSSITPLDYDASLTLRDTDTSGSFQKVDTSALANARHIQSHASEPLTLFHFSDIHADTSALSRLMEYAEQNATSIDDMICTGDIVANTAVPISSWWDERVLTCVGNHDAASYSSQTGYDWDALSMEDRVAYYIAPFESNWGINREEGKSYYYKDYPIQKVRLIVMDSQSYLVNGEEAASQTAWLVNLLSNAVLNNIHVLIAIHAPYNDADVVKCSFSKYGRQKMVHLNDSFTPQAVVDAVTESISDGLKFIGYIVGHNHQDYIYKPTERQLGFCVTCAAVSYAPQWYDSDQRRSSTLDAYNLVTIDTTNTLVKIIRGGGADIDNKMRTRKGICFNYSTGEKVGEVL